MLTRRILSSSNLSQEVPLPVATANGASILVETVLSDDVSINEGFTFCSDQEASSEVYDPVNTYEPLLSGEADIPVFMGYSSPSFSDESWPRSEVHDPIMTNSVDNLGSNKTMSKNMPKWTTQVRVSGGVNPPDDGFTWLKYGQKEILGAKFPRGYYRCIHKHAQGCEATKQVQRSDKDPTIFEVTYSGRHTCYQGSALMLPPSPKTPNQSLEPHTSDQQQQHSHPENPHQHLSTTPMGSEPSLMSESPHSLRGSPRRKDSDRDLRDQREIRDGSVKRKSIPRRTEQVRVSPGMGLEGPQDGFVWRKYGQKDILGAKFPRGYYRCTYRKVQGCWATKQVQRSDEDPTIFEVTYRGRHTCNQGSTVVLPPSQQTPVQSREPKHIPDQQQQHRCHQENLQQPNIPGPDEWTSTSNNVSVESSMFRRQTPAAPSKGPMFCILQQQHNHNKDQIKSEKVTQEFVPTFLRVKTEEVDLNLFSPRPSFLSSCHLPSTSIKSDDVKGDMFSSLKFRTKPNCHMKELPFSSGAGSMESFEETGGINPVDLSQGEEYRTSLKFLEGQDVKPNCHAKKPLPFALGEKGIIPFCLSQGYGTSLKFWECQDMKLISGRKVKDESMKSFQQVSLRELVFLEELQYVSWPVNPPRSLPSNVSPKFLIKLNMAHSSADQLWAGKQPLANLESIDLNHSKLTKIPDLSEAKKLGRLSLRGCQNLVETSSLQNLTKLEYLNLKGCKSLKSLPSMKNSKSLTTVILSGCSNLKQLPRLSPSIQYLYLAGTAIEELPPSIGSLSSLVKLDLRNCTRLRILPSSICELESLDYLDISGCLTLLQLL